MSTLNSKCRQSHISFYTSTDKWMGKYSYPGMLSTQCVVRCVYEWNYFSFVVYCSVCTVLCDSWLLKHIINEEFKFIPMTLHKYYDFRDGVYLFLHLTVQFFFHTTTPYSLPMLLPHTIYPMFPSHTFRTLHMPSIPFNSSKRGIVGAVSSAKRRRG